MDVQSIDLGGELVKSVERGLARPPVVFISPITGQITGVSQRNTLAPVVHGFCFWPSSARQTRSQIIEDVVGNIDPKRRHSRPIRSLVHAPDLATAPTGEGSAKAQSA